MILSKHFISDILSSSIYRWRTSQRCLWIVSHVWEFKCTSGFHWHSFSQVFFTRQQRDRGEKHNSLGQDLWWLRDKFITTTTACKVFQLIFGFIDHLIGEKIYPLFCKIQNRHWKESSPNDAEWINECNVTTVQGPIRIVLQNTSTESSCKLDFKVAVLMITRWKSQAYHI